MPIDHEAGSVIDEAAVKELDHTLVGRAGQLRPVMDTGADARIVVIGNPDQASAIVVDQRQQGVWRDLGRSEEHTSELQSLMRISYAVFCLTKKKTQQTRDARSNT